MKAGFKIIDAEPISSVVHEEQSDYDKFEQEQKNLSRMPTDLKMKVEIAHEMTNVCQLRKKSMI